MDDSRIGWVSWGASLTASRLVPTPSGDWPVPLGPAAYHGVVGEFVREISPHTESDPAAVLVQTLVCLGNAFGRGPHFHVEDTRHGTNLFAVVVGATSTARKGTSLDRAQRLVALADPAWDALNNGEGGLSSPEGLIMAVRDPVPAGDGKERDQGVEDKRLLVTMSEWGEVLAKMKRDGNPLGATLRNAWDGKTLRNRVKNRPLTATGAHISVIGHITQAELNDLLSQTDVFNGFGNRFLWVCAKRARELPHGGQLRVDEMEELIGGTARGINWAQSRLDRLIDFDAASKRRWEKLYHDLGEGPDGPVGAITDRAEAQVRRLALVYAVADRSKNVCPQHLAAALEVWRYCEASAEYLFADAPATSLEARVQKVLIRADDWVSRSRLYRKLRTEKPYQLDAVMGSLIERGRVEYREIETPGRPRKEYRAILS
jgi:hypothetical protein